MDSNLYFLVFASCLSVCLASRAKTNINSMHDTFTQVNAQTEAATCKFSSSDYPGWLFHEDWDAKPFELTYPTAHCCCTTSKKYTKDDNESMVVPNAEKYVCKAFLKGRRYRAKDMKYVSMCKCGDDTVRQEIGKFGWHSPKTWHRRWKKPTTLVEKMAMQATCLRLSEALLKSKGDDAYYDADSTMSVDKILNAPEYARRYHTWQELLKDSKAVKDPKKVGTCVPVEVQKNFDLAAYAAKRWYIQQQQVTEYLPVEQNFCVSADYTLLDKPTFWGYEVKVRNHAEEKDGTVHDSGNFLCAHQYSKEDPAKLSVAPCFLPTSFAGAYWVIAYDEIEGYVVVSGGQPSELNPGQKICRTGTGVNNAGLWIFTRAQQRDERLVQKARSIAESKGLDIGVLNDVDQSNCKLFVSQGA